MAQELQWRRAGADPEYFFESFVYTVDKTAPTGRALFKMTDYQREDLHIFENNSSVIILKARQLGISTLTAAYVLWQMTTKPGFNVITTSKSDVAAQTNLAKLVFAYHAMPEWIKDRFVIESETTSTFRIKHTATGMVSKMLSVAATETVGAGDTYDLAILDEMALSKYQDKTYMTVKPAVSIAATMKKSASMIVLSTARGSHNTFAQMFRAAQRGENQFVPIFHPWHVSPWMTQAAYDAEAELYASKGKPWEVYSEFPASAEEAFRESGQPMFRELPPVEMLSEFDYRGRIQEEMDVEKGELVYKFLEDTTGPLYVKSNKYLADSDERFYVAMADSSAGEGGDYQACIFYTFDDNDVDMDPEIVAYYYSNNVPPEEFAEDLDRTGRFFKGRQHATLLGVENQGGYGLAVINALHGRLQYPNPYIYRAVGRNSTSRTAGMPFSFPMTRNVREAILQRLQEYLANVNPNKLEAPYPRIKNIFPLLRYELGGFVKQVTPGGQVKYAADTGLHDDLVMSAAMGLWALLESYEAPHAQESTVDRQTSQWQNLMELRRAAMERTAEPQDAEELIYL